MHDIEPGSGSSLIEKFTIVGSKLFALATTTLYGREVWVINNFVTLPLDFLFFSAQKCNINQVCLTWKTANEQNVSHFEIERSSDGRSFTAIKNESANNQPLNLYSTTDDISSLASANIIYYRIKQLDVDGKATYSQIAILRQRALEVEVFPTVFSKSFTVQNNNAGIVQLQLYDAEGRLLQQQKLQQGVNTITLSSNYSGIIIYKLNKSDKVLQAGKLIKQ
jgi:hypothetical protein